MQDDNKNIIPIEVYSFDNIEVRSINKNGELWFILKDLCDVLGLVNPSEVAKSLFQGNLSSIEVAHQSENSIGSSKMNIVNEAGMYQTIFQSRKPNAQKFQQWVTSEVLPSIRKTGQYESPRMLSEDHKRSQLRKDIKSQKNSIKL